MVVGDYEEKKLSSCFQVRTTFEILSSPPASIEERFASVSVIIIKIFSDAALGSHKNILILKSYLLLQAQEMQHLREELASTLQQNKHLQQEMAQEMQHLREELASTLQQNKHLQQEMELQRLQEKLASTLQQNKLLEQKIEMPRRSSLKRTIVFVGLIGLLISILLTYVISDIFFYRALFL
ncbi:uncharacterized protein LOC110033677 [Phalaenopsis equestris]|uniref:uncharacterized protein LOC110033677 n=1 Tax=Phalaenopsis equestris TaxID=78828 RepID=UPI0009E4CF49|nr:uncharacterized protein LOC110033677 [Phalaenopsis equestris]